VRSVLPLALAEAAERSAEPDAVAIALRRIVEEHPSTAERLLVGHEPSPLARAFITVVAASNALGRLCVADPTALDILETLDRPVPVGGAEPNALARSKRLELLRIAARDLLGMDELEDVGRALSDMAALVLDGAWRLATGGSDDDGFAVIGMGKLGGRELNYASDVDVLFVTGAGGDTGDSVARELLRIARGSFRVDVDLRPEGRSGPLTRSLDGFRSYWDKRADAWEFQALLKARPVAGSADLGHSFAAAAARAVWRRSFSADELAELRSMKARAETDATRHGLVGSEIKRSPGGIRDVEFSVQLLQLVHGHHDPTIRDRSTLGALAELAAGGYVSGEDAVVLADSYRFLRTVEHRLQLVEEEQTHALPTEPAARRRLARVLGFTDGPSTTATASFDDTMRRCQSDVRIIHERLFFRPLLEAFAALEAAPTDTAASSDTSVGAVMSADAVARRLDAFGFGDTRRTRAVVEELAGGLTRVSRLMGQLLPLLLDWLSVTPDPDLGLLGLRTLVVRSHHRALVVTTFRESPEAARRLCLVLGSSLTMAEAIERNPELIAELDDDDALAPAPRAEVLDEAIERLRRPGDEGRRRARLVRLAQDHTLRIATRDLLDIDDVASTGAALTDVAEVVLGAALDHVAPDIAFCVVGLGRLGGAEMSYASDLDVLFVFDDPAPGAGDRGEETAEALLRFIHGPSPAQRVATVDLGLRPEGGQGRLARDLHGYGTYFERWAQTWERQALLRARVVAGDADLGRRFLALVRQFVWERPFTAADVAAIRRMKARVERERIPPREDPQFHLKLGRGSLSDIEWTAQLLQLRHGVSATGTMAALDALSAQGALTAADADVLGHAYRFLEHTRNRWHLVGTLPGGTPPGDSLPTETHQQSRLARSLGTSPVALRDEYRRVTRRARRVVERLFYGIDEE
jgi:[glutamine synthetase] adenylyltransferase / [glutamine synthetase]-adenylyl-L-tyrosine phosphorylase